MEFHANSKIEKMVKNVVVWGTGNVGKPAIRAVTTHQELNLAGVIVHNDSKVGTDAGEIAGVGNLGVQATSDIKIAEAYDVDAVVYTVNADFRPEESLSEIIPLLKAGKNVVSTSFHSLLHPPSTPEPMHSQVLEACREGNSSIFVSGIDPGWIIDILPLLLTGMSSNITEIRAQEIANYAGYDQPDAVRFLCGFGQSMNYDVPILTDWALMQVWAPMIRVLADGLQVELDEITTEVDKRPLEKSVFVDGMGDFENGTQGALRFEVKGIVKGEPLLVIEHITRIDDDCAPEWTKNDPDGGYHNVIITGEPSLTVSVHGEDSIDPGAASGGNSTAANRIVNAIIPVCEADSGIIHPLDLPTNLGSSQIKI
jgi:hypothetical protein